MTTSIIEHHLDNLRWLVVKGPRLDAFRALGEHARQEIHDVIEGMPERPSLERYVATVPGGQALDRVRSASAAAHPMEYAELGALAQGAGLPFDTVLLANVRGDLGGDDGTGCSDLGWRGTRSVVAHNEDGAPALQGRFMFVTLDLDGQAPVTTQWYAGFLPSNTFAATGHGLVWGINHLHVGAPADAAGRHFVARGLQQCPTLDSAIDYLCTHPSAGGFTYTIGEASTGQVVTVEAAAGRVAVVAADQARPFLWHTNHARYLDGEDGEESTEGGGSGTAQGDLSVVDEAARSLGLPEESVSRGCVLDALALPDTEPTADWFLDVLTTPAPRGVYRSAEGDDPLMTLCSTSTDLTLGEVTVQPRGGARVTIPLADLCVGRPPTLGAR